jgi:hypothetical protein
MIKDLKVFIYLIYLIIGLSGLNACSSANNKPVSIGFSRDSTTILLKNIDPAGLHQLQTMGSMDSLSEALVHVLDTPADEDSTGIEQEVPGKIRLLKDALEFRPLKPFARGRQYLVTSYLNVRFGNLQNALKGTLSNRVKPTQQLLKR